MFNALMAAADQVVESTLGDPALYRTQGDEPPYPVRVMFSGQTENEGFGGTAGFSMGRNSLRVRRSAIPDLAADDTFEINGEFWRVVQPPTRVDDGQWWQVVLEPG